jgi:ATP-dependent RNA/DNA helicase IGHMBP2
VQNPVSRFAFEFILYCYDVVAIRPSKGDSSGEPLCSGVVYRVRDCAVEVAVDDAPDALDGALRIERLANTKSHQLLVQALERVGKAPWFRGGGGGAAAPPGGGVGVGAGLVDVLFGRVPPRFGGSGGKGAAGQPIKAINKGLDHSQLAAVEHALSAADVALIHGPPGRVGTFHLRYLAVKTPIDESRYSM